MAMTHKTLEELARGYERSLDKDYYEKDIPLVLVEKSFIAGFQAHAKMASGLVRALEEISLSIWRDSHKDIVTKAQDALDSYRALGGE